MVTTLFGQNGVLGSVSLVYPLNKIYDSTFQRQWDRTMEKIRFTSPGDLEQMDKLTRRLDRLYEFSGMKNLSKSLGSYPDEYSKRIQLLRSDMCESIRRKFQEMARKAGDGVMEPDSIHDYDTDRKSLDDGLVQFRLLRAFYRRWKLHTKEYCQLGMGDEYVYTIRQLAHKLARKHTLLMQEFSKRKSVVDYRQRLDVLDSINREVSKTVGWYSSNYLNRDWKNSGWSGVGCEEPWMTVDYFDQDACLAPLERLRKVPSGDEVKDLQRLFERFADFYRKHGLIDIKELGAVFDYALLREYADAFSFESDDADERLKANLMEQLLDLSRVVHDAKSRLDFKVSEENRIKSSFAMYFAPIDEIYQILQDGFICSHRSVHTKTGKHIHNSLIFRINADIHDGDIGFIFPMTKVVENHMFYQLSKRHDCYEKDDNDILHVINKDSRHPVRIDIRNGIFIAPKERIVRYSVGSQVVRQSTEEYFRQFFIALSHSQGSPWFDSGRLHNWLSRHCVFYDDRSRRGLLNMLRDKGFVKIMNHFTNRNFDNLALAPVDGELKTSEFYAQHRFDEIRDSIRDPPDTDRINLSLFEWVRREA